MFFSYFRYLMMNKTISGDQNEQSKLKRKDQMLA